MTQAAAGSRAAETAWTEARSASDERLAAIEDTLDGLAERLEAVTRDGYTSTDERLGRVESRLEEMSATLLPEAVASQERWGDEIRGALGHVATALDRSLGSLGESLTEAMRISADADRNHVDEVVSQLREALDEAVGVLDQRISLTRDNASAANADLRGFLSSFQAATEERLEDVRGALAGGLMEARPTSSTSCVRRSTHSPPPTATRGGWSRKRSARCAATSPTHSKKCASGSRRRSPARTTRSPAPSTGNGRSSVRSYENCGPPCSTGSEESTATVATGLDELRGGVTSAARAGEVTTAHVTEFAETMASLEAIVAEMHADWDRRTTPRSTSSLPPARRRSASSVARCRRSSLISRPPSTPARRRWADHRSSSPRRPSDWSTAGQALLGYLARRDEILEAQRDRIVHEVLDEFAQGLSAEGAAGDGERVGAALDRRRDARDADRYRRSAEGLPALDPPEVPADLSALTEPLPEPKKPKNPKAGQARSRRRRATGGEKARRRGRPPRRRRPRRPHRRKAGSRQQGLLAKAPASAQPRRTTARRPRPRRKRTGQEGAPPPPPRRPTADTAATCLRRRCRDDTPLRQTPGRNCDKPSRAGQRPVRRRDRARPLPRRPPEEPTQANTTEPLDGEGTTRV